MSAHLGCRPTVEEICALNADFGALIRDIDKRFQVESNKVAEVKQQYKAVMNLNTTSKAETNLKSSDSRYLRRSTRVAEDTMEIVEASMNRLQRIVDCLANDFSRVDHGMIVSTQVEHLEYIDDLNSKCDLLELRVAEQRDRINLVTCADESRLFHSIADKITTNEKLLVKVTSPALGGGNSVTV